MNPPTPPEWLLARYPLHPDQQPRIKAEPLDMALGAVLIAGLCAFVNAYGGLTDTDLPTLGWLFVAALESLNVWFAHRALRSWCHQEHAARRRQAGNQL